MHGGEDRGAKDKDRRGGGGAEFKMVLKPKTVHPTQQVLTIRLTRSMRDAVNQGLPGQHELMPGRLRVLLDRVE